jgi:hypothetical protein
MLPEPRVAATRNGLRGTDTETPLLRRSGIDRTVVNAARRHARTYSKEVEDRSASPGVKTAIARTGVARTRCRLPASTGECTWCDCAGFPETTKGRKGKQGSETPVFPCCGAQRLLFPVGYCASPAHGHGTGDKILSETAIARDGCAGVARATDLDDIMPGGHVDLEVGSHVVA